jgi:hypothetical protein
MRGKTTAGVVWCMVGVLLVVLVLVTRDRKCMLIQTCLADQYVRWCVVRWSQVLWPPRHNQHEPPSKSNPSFQPRAFFREITLPISTFSESCELFSHRQKTLFLEALFRLYGLKKGGRAKRKPASSECSGNW